MHLELLQDAGIQRAAGRLRARRARRRFRSPRAAADAARAEKLIAENPLPDEEAEEVDPSSELDLETIASAASEMEAMGIKNLLDSNGIAAVLVGDSVLPNFPSRCAWLAIKPNAPGS
jgi:hypothetical protein